MILADMGSFSQKTSCGSITTGRDRHEFPGPPTDVRPCSPFRSWWTRSGTGICERPLSGIALMSAHGAPQTLGHPDAGGPRLPYPSGRRGSGMVPSRVCPGTLASCRSGKPLKTLNVSAPQTVCRARDVGSSNTILTCPQSSARGCPNGDLYSPNEWPAARRR